MKKCISIFTVSVFIVSNLLFFTACNKKTAEKEADIEYYDNDGFDLSFPVYNSDRINENEHTIENISSSIFKNFKTEWVYPNLDSFLTTLGIGSNVKIDKKTIDNYYQTLEGSISEYTIESDKYKLVIMNFSTIPDKYYLSSIEININDNNYSQLFPYTNKKDFDKDEIFGAKLRAHESTKNEMISYAMRYGDDEYLGYSDLRFKNGNLDAICIRMYWP